MPRAAPWQGNCANRAFWPLKSLFFCCSTRTAGGGGHLDVAPSCNTWERRVGAGGGHQQHQAPAARPDGRGSGPSGGCSLGRTCVRTQLTPAADMAPLLWRCDWAGPRGPIFRSSDRGLDDHEGARRSPEPLTSSHAPRAPVRPKFICCPPPPPRRLTTQSALVFCRVALCPVVAVARLQGQPLCPLFRAPRGCVCKWSLGSAGRVP